MCKFELYYFTLKDRNEQQIKTKSELNINSSAALVDKYTKLIEIPKDICKVIRWQRCIY